VTGLVVAGFPSLSGILGTDLVSDGLAEGVVAEATGERGVGWAAITEVMAEEDVWGRGEERTDVSDTDVGKDSTAVVGKAVVPGSVTVGTAEELLGDWRTTVTVSVTGPLSCLASNTSSLLQPRFSSSPFDCDLGGPRLLCLICMVVMVIVHW